jgi:hypothetical protein
MWTHRTILEISKGFVQSVLQFSIVDKCKMSTITEKEQEDDEVVYHIYDGLHKYPDKD